MGKTFKQLIDEAKELRLSQAEKTEVKDSLILFMKNNPNTQPVRAAGLIRPHSRRSILTSFQIFLKQPIKTMPALIAIIILLSGGVSVAAEQSLPGDALYSVKVHVNESVRGWAALSNEAKANWEAAMAARRLDEAEELAAEARLDAEVRAQLEANFQKHADKVQARINSFEDKDANRAAEIISNFETSLRVHERILLSIGTAKDATTEPETNSLAAKVRAEAQESKKDNDEKETRVSAQTEVQVAAEGRMNAAENKIAEVRKYIVNRKNRLGVTATAQAEARLKVAEDLLVQGKAKLDAKAYGEAFVLFGRAQSKAQEAKLLIKAKIEFESHEETPGASASPSVSVSPRPSPTLKIRASGKVELEDDDNGGEGRIRIELGL